MRRALAEETDLCPTPTNRKPPSHPPRPAFVSRTQRGRELRRREVRSRRTGALGGSLQHLCWFFQSSVHMEKPIKVAIYRFFCSSRRCYASLEQHLRVLWGGAVALNKVVGGAPRDELNIQFKCYRPIIAPLSSARIRVCVCSNVLHLYDQSGDYSAPTLLHWESLRSTGCVLLLSNHLQAADCCNNSPKDYSSNCDLRKCLWYLDECKSVSK